jgi:hypothetical protein
VTLDARARNRAILARQGLLERQDLRIVDAVERFGGLQAQEPASPFIGLWTRLRDVTPQALADAFMARDVVKATLMRMTLHAVSAADYRRLRPALRPLLEASRRLDRTDTRPPLEHLAAMREAIRPVIAEPRLQAELRSALAVAVPDADPDVTLWWFRRYADLIHAPSADVPWAFGRRPRLVDADAWLGPADAAEEAAEWESTLAIVRRYLASFGPGTRADIGAWSGLPVGRLRPATDHLDAEGELRHDTDERGRDLLDLVDLPDDMRPPADTPAPPRLLPMWDSILLAHADRTIVIDDAHRSVVIARNGDTLPTFLIDGRVAGLWWIGGTTAADRHLELDPFGPLTAGDRAALEAEGERLLAVVEPLEPFVYRRYLRHRPPTA